jgi:hypothetical protein
MIQLKNGFFVIATKPDARTPKGFTTVLAVSSDMDKYAIWTLRIEDEHTFEGDYFDVFFFLRDLGDERQAQNAAFLAAVEAFKER